MDKRFPDLAWLDGEPNVFPSSNLQHWFQSMTHDTKLDTMMAYLATLAHFHDRQGMN